MDIQQDSNSFANYQSRKNKCARKPPIPKIINDVDVYSQGSWEPEGDLKTDVRECFAKIKQNLEKRNEVICFPDAGLRTWTNLPEFTIMDVDIKPTYKKHIVRGFEKADRSTREQVKKMNEFLIHMPPEKIPISVHKAHNNEALVNKKNANVESLNVESTKGLIPVYTMVNSR